MKTPWWLDILVGITFSLLGVGAAACGGLGIIWGMYHLSESMGLLVFVASVLVLGFGVSMLREVGKRLIREYWANRR